MTLLRIQRRSVPNGDAFTVPAPGSFAGLTSAGVPVDAETALAIPTLLRGVSLLADSVSMLPLRGLQLHDDGTRHQLSPLPQILASPFANVLRQEGVAQVMHSLVLRGNAYLAVLGRDAQGYPLSLLVLNPDTVKVRQDTDGKVVYSYAGNDLDDGTLIHIRGLCAPQALTGVSIIENVRSSLGLTLAAQDFGARLFSQGALMSGVIEVPDSLDPDQAKAMASSFRAMHSGLGRAHIPAVLTAGAAYKPISISPEDSQFLQTRSFQNGEIATLLGIPPHLLGLTDKTTSWGSGIEVQGRAFVDYTLSPYLVRIAQVFTQLLPAGQYAQFDTDQITRADTTTRFAGYASGLTNGWLCVDEVRALEGLPPLPDGRGAIYRHPAAQVEADATDPAGAATTPLDPNDPGVAHDGAKDAA